MNKEQIVKLLKSEILRIENDKLYTDKASRINAVLLDPEIFLEMAYLYVYLFRNIKADKIPKDRLSTDLSDTSNHIWIVGKWTQRDTAFAECTYVCRLCGCRKKIIKFIEKGQLVTKIVSYTRNGQEHGPMYIPPCLGENNI